MRGDMNDRSSSTTEYIKFFVVIFGIISVSIALSSISESGGIQEYLRWFMGVFMVTFAAFKFIGYKSFSTMFAGYDVVAKRFSFYGKLFPFIQLALGLLYLMNLLPDARHALVLVVAGVSSIGVFKEISKRKSGVHCACLGNVIKLPLSTVSFVEDAGMFVMAGSMLLL